MPRYKVHYTADIWESVIVEAESKEKAKELFEIHDDNYFEAREDEPEQHGMENIRVDVVEELKWRTSIWIHTAPKRCCVKKPQAWTIICLMLIFQK